MATLMSDRERRLRFLDEGDLERLRDFFRLESVGEKVWLLLFFFFSLPSFPNKGYVKEMFTDFI